MPPSPQARAGNGPPQPPSDILPAGEYSVAVRTLCEFAAKLGDLDLRFTPAPSAQQGIAGHQAVAAARAAQGAPHGQQGPSHGPSHSATRYQAELPLAGQYRHLRVRGRADGYDPVAGRLDEVKTFKGDLARQPANHRALHWAQAKVYAALLCRQQGLAGLTVALVYYDVGRQQAAAPLLQHCTASELQQAFEVLCERFLQWADQELAHRAARDAALAGLAFPHPSFRHGQRPLAEAVYKAARAGRCLLAQAPTGIGKTLGTLFPLLKACSSQALDKLFFLTAKGSGRGLALAAVQTLRQAQPGLPLRVVELVARDKACEHPDKACHGDACPLARGFYDRLPAARSAAVALARHQNLDRDALRETALDHQVCPYYLGQELARWADLLVGDYNHFFDSHALLHGLTLANPWRVAVLVDEAHNLIERGRSMYSASLHSAAWRAARRAAPAALKKPLQRLLRCWTALAQAQTEPYRVLDGPPEALCSALQAATSAIADHLAEDPAASGPAQAALMAVYFDALQFCRLQDSFGAHSLIDLTCHPGRPSEPGALDAGSRQRRSSSVESTLCLRNLLPAPFLRPRFEATHCSVLFSATLAPRAFYADALGLPGDTAWVDVEAPFKPEQLQVQIVREVSTRYAHRAASLAPIARLLAGQYQRRPGLYLAFFSSFEYLAQAADALAASHPQVPLWRQTQRMDEAERAAFLARFTPGHSGIGFAVLGGVFAEGIDLPGSRLIGAFIATLGLPQVNPLNEELRRRQQAAFGAGYEYTYLYPGIRKVVQAAGRVIRTLDDQGSLLLIDDRFARPEVLRLLPAWWALRLRPDAAITQALAVENG